MTRLPNTQGSMTDTDTVALGPTQWATGHLLTNEHEVVLDAYRAMAEPERARLLGSWLANRAPSKSLQCSQHPALLDAILDDVGRPSFAAIQWPHWMIDFALAHNRLGDIPALVKSSGAVVGAARVLRAAVASATGEDEHDGRLADAVAAVEPGLGSFLAHPDATAAITQTAPLALLKALEARARPGSTDQWKAKLLDKVARIWADAPPKSVDQRKALIDVLDWAYTTGPARLPDLIVPIMFNALYFKPRQASRFVDWTIKRLVLHPSAGDEGRNLWHEIAGYCLEGNGHLLGDEMQANPYFARRIGVLMRHDILAPVSTESSRVLGLEKGLSIDTQLAPGLVGRRPVLDALLARARAAQMQGQTPDAAPARRAPRL